MKYTDSKNNITFNSVTLPGLEVSTGPLVIANTHTVSGNNITNVDEHALLYNAIDIDWNGAQIDGRTIKTTGDLLNWISTRKTNNDNQSNDVVSKTEFNSILDDLEDEFNRLNSLIDLLHTDLSNIGSTNQVDIQLSVKDIISEFNWLKKNFPLGELFAYEINNKAQWAKTYGLLYDNGNGTWSTLKQTFDRISARVSVIESSLSSNGQINMSELQANLEAYVNTTFGTAITNINSKWALLDENLQLIAWAMDGFRTSTSQYTSLAQMYSQRFDGINTAISGLTTSVTNLDGKIQSAQVTLGSQITKLEGDIETINSSGFVSTATLDSAMASVFSNVNSSSSTAVARKITAGLSTYATQLDLTTGLATARSSLLSEIDGRYASVSTAVTKNPTTGKINTEIVLSSDKVTFDTSIINALGSQLTVGSLSAGSGTSTINLDSSKGLLIKSEGNVVARIDTTGRILFCDERVTIPKVSRGTYDSLIDDDSTGIMIKPGTNSTSLLKAYYLSNGFNVLGMNGGVYAAFTGGGSGSGSSIQTAAAMHGIYKSGSTHVQALTFTLNLSASDLTSRAFLINNLAFNNNSYFAICGYKGIIFKPYGLNDTTHHSAQILTKTESNNVEHTGLSIYDGSHYYGYYNNEISGYGDLLINYTGTIRAKTNVLAESDERLKNITGNVQANIEDIANVRIVNYLLKGGDTVVHLGSIAQDWQKIFPNAVKEQENGMLSLDYSAVSVASSVIAAKEIVELKAENKELRELVKELTDRILNLEMLNK